MAPLPMSQWVSSHSPVEGPTVGFPQTAEGQVLWTVPQQYYPNPDRFSLPYKAQVSVP